MKRYSFWLVPSEKDRNYLEIIIKNLSKKYNSVAFMPHLTINVQTAEPGIIDQLFDDFKLKLDQEITLKINSIYQSGQISKTVFIQFKESQELINVKDKIIKHFGESDHKLDPHLSLIYKNSNSKLRNNIIKDTQLEIDQVSFNQLTVITTEKPLQKDSDVKNFQSIKEFQLI